MPLQISGSQEKLRASRADHLSEWIGVALLAGMWAFFCYAYFTLPAVIAIHFDAAGQADAQGGKTMLWVLPAIATIIYAGLTVLSRFPQMFNYPVRITAQNAQRQYSLAVRMLRLLKLAIVLVFMLALVVIWHASGQKPARPQVWLLPLILALVLTPIVLVVVQMLRERDNTGIKNQQQ